MIHDLQGRVPRPGDKVFYTIRKPTGGSSLQRGRVTGVGSTSVTIQTESGEGYVRKKRGEFVVECKKPVPSVLEYWTVEIDAHARVFYLRNIEGEVLYVVPFDKTNVEMYSSFTSFFDARGTRRRAVGYLLKCLEMK